MGAATTKILYIVTDNDLYIEREGKWVASHVIEREQ
jgi:hypothetical protein